MSRPSFTTAATWTDLERAVAMVFLEALRRLANRASLPDAENPTNLELYREALAVHWERTKAGDPDMLPFVILSECNNQPEPDDTARSARLTKRPDLQCGMMDGQAEDVALSQLFYCLECKRLGLALGAWNLNANYADNGIARFVDPAWGYARGSPSAVMIGYVQTQDPAAVLVEVNAVVGARGLPALASPAAGWTPRGVNVVTQPALAPSTPLGALTLRHFWVDLRACALVAPPAPAASSGSGPTAKRRGGAAKPKTSSKSPRRAKAHR